MSPRTGRPTDNPKEEFIAVRLDEESSNVLADYCEQKQVSKSEAVRRGIKRLKSDLRKE